MEDLRILEQQQKDAQRKLSQTRLTKENKQQQLSSRQMNLEKKKYANGELRAQIHQYHDALKFAQRGVSARKLATDRNKADIEEFSRRLDNGRKSLRRFKICRRKVESALIQLEGKTEILTRHKARVKQELAEMKNSLVEAEQNEQALRASIQQQLNLIQVKNRTLSDIRADNRVQDQEMLEAKNMEESTKIRADSLIGQIASEEKRKTDIIFKRDAQIEESKVAESKEAAAEAELVHKVEESAEELQAVKARITLPTLSEDDSEKCFYLITDSDGGLPSLDRNRMAKILQDQGTKANAEKKANEDLQREIEQLEAMLQQTIIETASLGENTATSESSARQRLEREQERRKKIEAEKEAEVTRVRDEVSRLKQSATELKEDCKTKKEEHKQRMGKTQTAITQTREETEKIRKQIEVFDSEVAKSDAAWEVEKAAIIGRLQEAKDKSRSTEQLLQGLPEKYRVLNEELEADFERRRRESDKKERDHVEKKKFEMSELLESKYFTHHHFVNTVVVCSALTTVLHIIRIPGTFQSGIRVRR